MRKTKRAYKYRFYPTDEQKRILAQTFGCCRFVYNWGLSLRKMAYFQHGQFQLPAQTFHTHCARKPSDLRGESGRQEHGPKSLSGESH